MNLELNADPEEIVQAEEPDAGGPIRVEVCGPTEVRELPAVRVGYATAQGVTAAAAVKVCAREPRRKQAVIIGQDQDLWISNTQAGAQMGAASAMRWPAVVPYVVTHLEEVWVCAVTGTTDVGVATDYWSN